MTPKEKAGELMREFFPNLQEALELELVGIRKKYVIKCALIAVNEIIKANPYKWVPFMDQYTETVLTSNIEYWQEVKQELEKIRDN